jgi:hypothetical protein
MGKTDLFRGAVLATAAVLLVLAAACRQSPPDFQMKLAAPGAGFFTQYKLVVDGALMGPFNSTQPYQFNAHGHSGDSPKDMMPHVDASVLYVCGWQPVKIEMHPPSEYDIEQARKERRSIPVTMYLGFEPPSWQEVTVLVDNRGGPAAHLAVGENEQSVPANDYGKFTFPYWPHCDEAGELRLNGEAIGKIEANARVPGTAFPLLLDTSGSRCYISEWRTYSTFPGSGTGSGHEIYKPQRLRTLSSGVDYFLHPLLSVEYSTNSVVQKSSLNEIACKNAK